MDEIRQSDTTLFVPPTQDQTWVDVEGFPGYQVNRLGEIRNESTGRILKPARKEKGYLRVLIGRPARWLNIHRAMAQAFIGPIPDGMMVHHLDGNPANNRLENLEIVTCSENCVEGTKRRAGLHRGSKSAKIAAMERKSRLAKIKTAGWPYPDLVKMTAHNGSGQWRKRHGKRDYYFGPIDDPDGALSRWRIEWPRIEAGRPRHPVTPSDGITMLELATAFLDFKTAAYTRKDISHATLLDYRLTCKKLLRVIAGGDVVNDLMPDDFARVVVSLSSLSTIKRLYTMTNMRSVFTFGVKNHLINPPRYGTAFNPPPRVAVRKARNEAKPKTLTAVQVHKMIEAADPQLRAMLWLGINCGIGNHDVAMLKREDIDLQKRWLVSRRIKTQAIRRCPLWPETVAAVKAAMAPTGPLVFVRSDGLPLYRRWEDDVMQATKALLESLGIPGGFYWLRHTFATVAENAGDVDASKIIMGHVIDGVHEGYVWKFPAARLQKVSQCVYRWLAKGRADRRVKRDATVAA